MKTTILSLAIILVRILAFSQVTNNDCNTATTLLINANEVDYCSTNTAFTTVVSANGQVWFKFIAKRSDISITAIGHINGSQATLLVPNIEFYQDCATPIHSSLTHSGNLTTLYKGGLIIGSIYYFTISGNTAGSFKLCINNYTPILHAGQDCGLASFLCNKQTFTQNNVAGGGTNTNEAQGTCLASQGVNTDQNSVWYKWIAANNGTLTFTITPSSLDDIDWVLFDLGTTDDCAKANPTNAIRCAAGRGIDCNPFTEAVYSKTGLSLSSTDTNEAGGCLEGQDGFVKYVDMTQGHIYGLLVNNFDSSDHGFTIEFGGTSTFLGPQAKIDFTQNTTCWPYTFNSLSSNYTNLQWSFGAGASINTATGPGPFNINYTTPGVKTIVLQAFNDKGCSVIDTKEVIVPEKYKPTLIGIVKQYYCIGDILILSTPIQPNTTFLWSGPNAFSSTQSSITIPIDNENRAGIYSLLATVNNCSDGGMEHFNITIDQKPVAAFKIQPQFITGKYASGNIFEFVNTSLNADHYIWDFGDGSSSDETNPTHIYAQKGSFDVKLHAFNSRACNAVESLSQRTVAIEVDAIIRNYNVFTPNNDTENPDFFVNVVNIKSYKIRIFDRLGIQVFTSEDSSENWTGIFHNNSLPVGVYYYAIEVLDLNGNNLYKTGSIAIIK